MGGLVGGWLGEWAGGRVDGWAGEWVVSCLCVAGGRGVGGGAVTSPSAPRRIAQEAAHAEYHKASSYVDGVRPRSQEVESEDRAGMTATHKHGARTLKSTRIVTHSCASQWQCSSEHSCKR